MMARTVSSIMGHKSVRVQVDNGKKGVSKGD